jgi:hypothetical protein
VSRLAIAFTLAFTLTAHADPSSTGIVADRFVPGIGPLTLLAGEGADTTPFKQFSFALSLGLVKDPIRLQNQFTGQLVSRPVAQQLTFDLGLEVGVWRWLAVGVGVPLVLNASGDRLRGTGDDRPLDAQAAGDLRLRVKAAFIGDPHRHGLHVGVLLQLTAPLGGQSSFFATDGVTVEPRIEADLRYGRLVVLVSLGARFGPDRRLFGTELNDELTWLGGAALRVYERGRFRAGLLAEIQGAVGPSDGTRPIEVRGGLRVAFSTLSLDLAAGGGVVSDVGAPAWRILAVFRRSVELF